MTYNLLSKLVTFPTLHYITCLHPLSVKLAVHYKGSSSHLLEGILRAVGDSGELWHSRTA